MRKTIMLLVVLLMPHIAHALNVSISGITVTLAYDEPTTEEVEAAA